MTLGDATAVAADERALALGYAQRRSWIFWAWRYGVALAITGTADAILSGLVGQDPSRGISMGLLGAPISALGWLLTLGVRFSKKLPKPAKDLLRVALAPNLDRNPQGIDWEADGARWATAQPPAPSNPSAPVA